MSARRLLSIRMSRRRLGEREQACFTTKDVMGD